MKYLKGVFTVAGIEHRLSAIGSCSCGQGPTPGGPTAGHVANSWKLHVHNVADGLGVAAQRVVDPRVLPVASVPALCPSCGWTGRRRAPNDRYRGTLGPCPQCRERVVTA